jgi:sterol desaturase/sphingolipid hydroxylase (fatty acid hydroxylase superfamily)
MSGRELPAGLRLLAIAGTAAALLTFELRRSLRPERREPKLVRSVRNLVIATLAGFVVGALEGPLSHRVARHMEDEELGLAPMISRSPAVRVITAVVALDYGLYLWHVLTHRVPFLWRFHLVHHVDLGMDQSTAIRFHFGEMLLSVPWRLAQIRLAGAPPLAVSIWQTLLFCSILFHHSNVRLPYSVERWLRFLIVTPRLHDIHHRAERWATDSNWSSGLACWDLLHGTYLWCDSQAPIGVPAWQNASDVTLLKSLRIPFEPQRDDWLSDDGADHSAVHSQGGAIGR